MLCYPAGEGGGNQRYFALLWECRGMFFTTCNRPGNVGPYGGVQRTLHNARGGMECRPATRDGGNITMRGRLGEFCGKWRGSGECCTMLGRGGNVGLRVRLDT